MIIYIFRLLPLPVPKVLTGQAFGHCTAAVVNAGKFPRDCSAEECGNDHGGVGSVYWPVLLALHSFEPPKNSEGFSGCYLPEESFPVPIPFSEALGNSTSFFFLLVLDYPNVFHLNLFSIRNDVRL